MLIQERLLKLQEWALTGIRLVELPTVEEYGAAESELALLQYCYYRLIHHVAGNIKENPNYDVHEFVDVFLSSPFGSCVSKEMVVALCELLMTSELRCYCRGALFPQGWTADDVAGTILSVDGGTKDLLKAAIEDSSNNCLTRSDLQAPIVEKQYQSKDISTTTGFSVAAIEALQAYVYILVDPRDSKIFYVGKGNGNRVFQQATCALSTSDASDKLDIIRSIMNEGKEVQYYIVRHGLTDDVAFTVESVLIDFLTYQDFKDVAKITNIVAGHHQFDMGIKTVEEIEQLYNVKELTEAELNAHKIIAINVNKTYGINSEFHPNLYEATRKSWDVSGIKASKAEYVLSEYRGIVRGIFKPEKWIEVTSNTDKHKRWAFEGVEISKESNPSIYNMYMNKLLPPREKGAQKPFRYFGY